MSQLTGHNQQVTVKNRLKIFEREKWFGSLSADWNQIISEMSLETQKTKTLGKTERESDDITGRDSNLGKTKSEKLQCVAV